MERQPSRETQNKLSIEVCCGSVDDALEAQAGGADRIELNSNLFFGGLTPSMGSILETKKRLSIPVMVMIRPRGGGFCYTEVELSTMERDMEAALEAGAEGVVFGILKEDGTVDMDRCRRLIESAGNTELVFHRAFDVVPDMLRALEQLIELGFTRILTTGQKTTVEEGADNLRRLIEVAAERIQILPAGIKRHNAQRMVEVLGCRQIHIASFINRQDRSTQVNPEIYYGSALYPPEDRYQLLDRRFVSDIRQALK